MAEQTGMIIQNKNNNYICTSTSIFIKLNVLMKILDLHSFKGNPINGAGQSERCVEKGD